MGELKDESEIMEEKRLNERNGGIEYMSDMKNWVCVHLTQYEPKRNSDGSLSIETTAMATDYDLPRATVHVTLNQRVGNHGYGNWDKASIIILAPYNDVVAKNGNPQEVATEDTFFIPDPDTGLVLPKSAYIIRPDFKTDKLFEIGEHSATYKAENYTEQEVNDILSMNNWDRDTYEKYMSGDIPEYDIDMVLGYDKNLRKIYDNTKDKKAFLRGMLEEDRFLILNKLLRDHVMSKAFEKMGYRQVYSHEDSVSGKAAEVARAAGIRGDSGNKGHHNSLEAEMDRTGMGFVYLKDAIKEGNIEEIHNRLGGKWDPVDSAIISSILNDSPLPDLYRSFEKAAVDFRVEKIEEYNPRLSTVLHRFADKMATDIKTSLDELKQKPIDYKLLQSMLRDYEDADGKISKSEWLKKTRKNYERIEASQKRIAELQKRKGEESTEYLQSEKTEEKNDIARYKLAIEDDYKDINPELAHLRAEEKTKIKNGMDPQTAKKEHRDAVKAFYISQQQKLND